MKNFFKASIISSFLFAFCLEANAECFSSSPQKCKKPKEQNGDSELILNTNNYTYSVTTNNLFGKVTSNLNTSMDLLYSQRWTEHFKPFIYAGTNNLSFSFPWGDYRDGLFYWGYGAQLNICKYFTFTVSHSKSDDILFREMNSYPIGYIVTMEKTKLDGQFSLYKGESSSLGLGLNWNFISDQPDYGYSQGSGFGGNIFYNLDYKNFLLKAGFFSQKETSILDGRDQKRLDTGFSINLGFRIPYQYAQDEWIFNIMGN